MVRESVQRIGIAQSRRNGWFGLFHRVRVKLSRRYRVWPVAGRDDYIEYDPCEFSERFAIVEEFRTDQGGTGEEKRP